MTVERWAYLAMMIYSVLAALFLNGLSRRLDTTRTGRLVSGALDSWFMRARWSASPERRIRRGVWACWIVFVIMLVLFITDPQPRYAR